MSAVGTLSAAAAGAGVDPVVWTVLAALMAAGGALAVLLSWRAECLLGRRLRSLSPPRPEAQAEPERRALTGRRPWSRFVRRFRGALWRDAALALGVTASGVAVLGGPVGWAVGGLAGWAVWHWRRRARRREPDGGAGDESRSVERQLPLAAELLAACLTAGSGPAQAAEAVGRSTGGPLGERLVRAAAELRLGGEPAAVWSRFGALPGCVALARCMERAGTAGVPPVRDVARLAAECRSGRARAAGGRARRAAVLVTGPLGLCFLPAFLAVGVAPVVIGLARSLL